MTVYDVFGSPKEVRSNRKNAECKPLGAAFISVIIAYMKQPPPDRNQAVVLLFMRYYCSYGCFMMSQLL